MEKLPVVYFCENLKREAFKEQLIGDHCNISIESWIKCLKNKCTTNDSGNAEYNILRFKMLNQILKIIEEQLKIYAPCLLIGIEVLCEMILQYNMKLEDGWLEKHTIKCVINDLLESLKYELIRENSIPALVKKLNEEAYNYGILDPSIVVDCNIWMKQILGMNNYRGHVIPDECDDHLFDTYALSTAERMVQKNKKKFDRQFLDLFESARRDNLVGSLISIPMTIEMFNESKESYEYTCTFTSWSKKVIANACLHLIETFQMALTETAWSDVLVAKFIDPDKYGDVSFLKWHETMFNLQNPPALLHLLYKDEPEEEREVKHKIDFQNYIDEEKLRYATYQIERIEGEFAKLCDADGKIITLQKC